MWRMAALAQEGRTALQQTRGRRAMRIVAIAAAFIDRLVVVHEGTALFHVAGVASFNHTVALHQAGACRAVGVVAVRAGHLAFKHRVVRGLVEHIALIFVAGKADLALREFVAHRIFCGMHFVACSTGHVARLVGASIPMASLGVIGMALLAGTVACIGRRHRFGIKGHTGVRALARAFVVQVLFAGTMATCTGRRTRVSLCAVPRFANGQEFGTIGLIVTRGARGIAL